MATDDIPIFPVTGVNLRSVESQGLLLLQLPFLSHALQKMHEADPGRNYALTIAQAEELRDMLARAIQKMKIAGPQGSEGPRY